LGGGNLFGLGKVPNRLIKFGRQCIRPIRSAVGFLFGEGGVQCQIVLRLRGSGCCISGY